MQPLRRDAVVEKGVTVQQDDITSPETLWLGGVALCSVVTIKVLLKVLGKTFVMVKRVHRRGQESKHKSRKKQKPAATTTVVQHTYGYATAAKTRQRDGEKVTSTRARKQALVA